MNITENHEEFETLRAAIVLVIRQAGTYWEGLADDYQTKYAFSSDYDKSYKQDYYRRARECRSLAHRIEQVSLPTIADERDGFIDTIVREVGQFPRQIRLQRELEPLIGRLNLLRE